MILALAAGLYCDAARSPLESDGSGTSSTYTITAWSTKDGLPADRVRHLCQDRLGFMWIATFSGVARFDGVRFRLHDISNTPELANNQVNALYEDRNGNMWLGHDNGEITVWRDGRFQKMVLDPQWLSSPIDQFAETTDGTVWARNRLSWLLPVTGVKPGAIRKEMGGQVVSDIATGRSGRLWMAGDKGVYFLDRASDESLEIHPIFILPPAREGSPSLVRPSGTSNPAIPMRWEGSAHIFRGRQHGIWVADHSQVRHWSNASWTGEAIPTQLRQRTWTNTWLEMADGRIAVSTYDEGLQFIHPSGAVQRLDANHGLPTNYITSMVEDREGNLWIGVGDRGLCRLRPSAVEMVGPTGGWGNWAVQTVIAARDGSVWAGTEGAGIFRLRNGNWTHLERDSGLTNLTVKTMLEDSSGRVWAGLTNGDFGVFEGDAFQTKFADPAVGPITAAFQARNGDLWIGGLLGVGRVTQGQLSVLQSAQGKFTKISGFAESTDGTIWIATMGNGLGRYRSGMLQVLGQADGLPSDFIWSLYAGPNEILYIGTDDRGLVTNRGGTFSKVEFPRGTPNNMVAQITADDAGSLWLGTNGGIVRLAQTELEEQVAGKSRRISVQVYDESEGLSTRGLTGGSQAGIGRTPDGLLWFATDRGLARIDPRISPPAAPLPPVIIETIRIDGSEVPATRTGVSLSLELEPGARRVEIDYTGLSLTAPHRSLFRYKLDGADENWSVAGTRRTAYFSYLRPGSYTFRVQSYSAEGSGGPDAVLNLNLKPHFWETGWFTSLAVALTLGIVAGTVFWVSRTRYRRKLEKIEQLQAIERDRTRIAHDIHDEIGSGLTQLSILSHWSPAGDTKDPETTERLREIEGTVREMTAAIDEIVWAVNPRHDSLESVVSYFAGVVQDFARRVGLQCQLNVPFDLDHLEITAERRHDLYLVLKEALNNVAKHAAASEVTFSVRSDADGFVFRLEDNGHGFPKAADQPKPLAPDGVGLESMRQRITKLGGSLNCTNRAEGGAVVVFRVALRPAT